MTPDCRFLLGDNLEVLQQLIDENVKVELIITSPPYNIGKSYEEAAAHTDYTTWLIPRLKKLELLLSPNGSLFINLGYSKAYNGHHVPLAYHLWNKFDTLDMRQEIIWFTRRGVACKNYFSPRHETILWFTKRGGKPLFDLDSIRVPHDQSKCTCGTRNGKKRCNDFGKNPSDVWGLDPSESLWNVASVAAGENRKSAERTNHPAQMPLEIAERLIKACSKPGDTVLDPFSGSGTTCVAATMLNRKAIGIEIDPQYHQDALKRVLSYND
jgi:adenine-specific DNA-methyltransferase